MVGNWTVVKPLEPTKPGANSDQAGEMNVMVCTVLGQVVSPSGHSVHVNSLGDPVNLTITEPLAYQRHQHASIPVHFAHDREWVLGHCAYLERGHQFGLVAVASITADIADLLDDGPWYYSDRITSQHLSHTPHQSNVMIEELSLVRETANHGTRPLVVAAGDLTDHRDGPRGLNLHQRDTWQRAAQAVQTSRYRSSAPII
jgi:hypothetical protein